ncbi:MAG: dethiobiotin synthase [Lewinellaceae bacterium]|nr:dethiobiotin synthase [Lewinellaceae bacterium]
MKSPIFFVSGIGTEVGKTVTSAILMKALDAAYWKPVQSGDLHWTDTDKVKSWTGLPEDRFFSERHRLNEPLSPHASAALDGIHIQLEDFSLPVTERPLLIEGAGGLLVPLNDQDTILDLIQVLQVPVVLVSRHYLGSINHTLLSIEVLQSRGVPIAGLLFNGPENKHTESAIQQLSGLTPLVRIDELAEINAQSIAAAAERYGAVLRKALLPQISITNRQTGY